MAWVIATHFVSIYNFPIICNHKYKHSLHLHMSCTFISIYPAIYFHPHKNTHIYILPTVHCQQINKVIVCMFTHTMQVL